MQVRHRLYSWGVLMAVLFLVFLVYGVCLDIPFAHHDVLRYFRRYFLSSPAAGSGDHYFPYSWVMGRPVAAVLEDYIFRHTGDLAGISRIRWVCTFFAGLLAWALVSCTRKLRWGAGILILLTVFLVCLPGIQDSIYMILLHYLLGALAAVGAFQVWISPLPTAVRTVGAMALLLFAFFSYSVIAFLFLSLLAIILLQSPPERVNDSIRKVLGGVVVLIISAGLYYVFTHFFLQARFPETAEAIKNGYHNLQPSFSKVPAKILYLFTDGSLFFCNPFYPLLGRWGGAAILLFICFAVMRNTSWEWQMRLRVLLMWWLLLLLSLGIWLVASLDLFLYRIFYPTMVLGTISFIWAVYNETQRLAGSRAKARVLVCILLGIGIWNQQQGLTLNVWNSNAELTFVRSQLARTVGRDVKRIHVVEPGYTGYALNGQSVLDDTHNMNSSTYEGNMGYLVKLGLWQQISERPLWHCWQDQKECLTTVPSGALLLTHSRPGEAVLPSENMVVVDYNDLIRSYEVFRK